MSEFYSIVALHLKSLQTTLIELIKVDFEVIPQMLTRYSEDRQMLKRKGITGSTCLFIVWENINGTRGSVNFKEILNWPSNFKDGISFTEL
jgi:hypothetical protein